MPLSVFINSISLKAHSHRSTRLTLLSGLSWAQLLREGTGASSPPLSPTVNSEQSILGGPRAEGKAGCWGLERIFPDLPCPSRNKDYFLVNFHFQKIKLFLTRAIKYRTFLLPQLSFISFKTGIMHLFSSSQFCIFLGDLSKPTGGRNMDTLFIKHSIKPFDLV